MLLDQLILILSFIIFVIISAGVIFFLIFYLKNRKRIDSLIKNNRTVSGNKIIENPKKVQNLDKSFAAIVIFAALLCILILIISPNSNFLYSSINLKTAVGIVLIILGLIKSVELFSSKKKDPIRATLPFLILRSLAIDGKKWFKITGVIFYILMIALGILLIIAINK